jgi:hypothetical protein
VSDIPTPLTFVDPTESSDLYCTVLWAAPGAGKSVLAASAPPPIVALTADRPGAYRFARKHHGLTVESLREVRYVNAATLDEVYVYLKRSTDVKTFVLDPFSNIYDKLCDEAPAGREGGPDYQWVNKKLLGFLKALHGLPIHVVIVAHERLNDGKKGDGKLYPALGGPALMNKVLAEVDIVAHVERSNGSEETEPQWGAQLQPRGNLVTKDSTGALGDRRLGDLTEWFDTASAELKVDNSDLPFDEAFAELADEGDVVDQGTLDEAAA